MKTEGAFSDTKIFIFLAFVIMIIYVSIVSDMAMLHLSDAAANVASSFTQPSNTEETKTIETHARVVIIQKGQSLIEVTGMNETQAREFAKDNGMDFDKNENPIVHEGYKFMLFPGSINPTDSVWSADNYHNKKTY